jgi:hypothetical protein
VYFESDPVQFGTESLIFGETQHIRSHGRFILSILKTGAVEYSAKIKSLLPEYAASHF